MLKRCNISRIMGHEKEVYLYLLFHYTGKKDFKENTPKIKMLTFGLTKTSHFGLWDITPPPPPPEPQLAFHIYYVNMSTHLRAEGFVGTL